MLKLLFATAAAVTLLFVAAPSPAGDKTDAAQKQSAVEHSREVQRMKEHTREQERKIRDQARKDREKVKDKVKEEAENAEQEEGFGHDLDDD